MVEPSHDSSPPPTSSHRELLDRALEIDRAARSAEDLREAETLYLAAHEAAPEGDYNALGYLAWHYYQRHRYEDAAETYRRILERDPVCFDALYYGARSLYRAGRRDAARPLFGRAARRSPLRKEGRDALRRWCIEALPFRARLGRTYRRIVWLVGFPAILVRGMTEKSPYRASSFMAWCTRNCHWFSWVLAYSRAREYEFAFREIRAEENDWVLDIGSGVSPYAIFAADRGIRLIASEPAEYIEGNFQVSGRTSNLVDEGRLGLLRADGLRLPFADSTLSRVLCISTIEHIPGEGDLALMREIARVLASGGRTVVTTEGCNRAAEFWQLRANDTGVQYEAEDEDVKARAGGNSYVGFYRLYDPARLLERLGSAPGLTLVEYGYIVDRLQIRGAFKDVPESPWEKFVSPWSALFGYFSLKRYVGPVPGDVNLDGGVAYVILEKPR